MWYVIQTETGKEERAKAAIERLVPSELFRECRILYYEVKRRYLGEWHLEKQRMFPGYLFIDSDQVDLLFLSLKKVPDLTKLLGYGEEIVPIRPEEEAFLFSLTDKDGMAAMSYGIQEGDRIIVKEGVLAGKESVIRKIDRHKRRAFIEIELLGEVRQIEIGLEIVAKR